MRLVFMSARPSNRNLVAGRRPWFRSLSLLVLLVGFLPLAPATQTARAVVPFRSVACPEAVLVDGIQVDCGYLTVPESRQPYTGKTIQLAVAILRSPNPNRAADPAVFLNGGPGNPTLAAAAAIAGAYAPTLAQRDIVLMDQRGTGYSQPLLACGFGTQRLSLRPFRSALRSSELPDFIQAQLDAYVACGHAFQKQGVDLRAYSSVESAADYEDLRLALGYGPWNIVGGSYGTRLALTMLQYRPQTLRSVVLDSVIPLQATFQVESFASYNQTLTRLAAACAADSACHAAYPDLLGTFDQTYAALNARAAQVPLVDPQSGKVVTYLPVSGVLFSNLVFQLFYSTPAISILPYLIGETGSGNYLPLGTLFGALLLAPLPTEPQLNLARAMYVAVQCNEDMPFTSREDFIRARDQNRRASALAFSLFVNEGFLDVCEALDLSQADPAENQAVTSDRPVLIISGENDPVTPPQYAVDAAATLSNSVVVTYPRGGHGPSFSSPCLAHAVAAFFADPSHAPDTACVAAEAPLPFFVPSGPQAARHALKRASCALQLTLP